jgi:hypothetical protein
VLTRLKPYLILAGLGLLYFGKLLVHPDGVLYSPHSDLLAYFLPTKSFLVHSWQECGELPLWCPNSYGGMPFIHDIQVAAFYPPHWPLFMLPVESLGAALSWLVVLHVILAGWCMYAYARWRGLEGAGAFVAALGYMFAGKWLMHLLAAGHYVMIPLAWLPLGLLLLESGISGRSWLRLCWAGAVFALILLGCHPQMAFYAGVFTALWTLGPVFGGGQSGLERRRFLSNWWIGGLCAGSTVIALSAVQMLPTLEAAREATRASGMREVDVASTFWPALQAFFGPGWDNAWEDRCGLSVLWVGAAALAPLLCRGRAGYEALLSLGLVIFSLGGAALVQWLPGFRLFQIPIRMAMLLALPVSLLAGQTVQSLGGSLGTERSCFGLARRMIIQVWLAGILLTAWGGAVAFARWRSASAGTHWQEWFEQLPARHSIYWGTLFIVAPVTLWLLSKRCTLRFPSWQAVFALILLADLWSLTWPMVEVRSVREIYPVSSTVRALESAKLSQPEDRWRVLDRGLPGFPSSAPLGVGLPLMARIGLEPVLGYNPLDVRRYKEYLQFIADEDGPIIPHEGILGFPIVQPFPIRNKALIDLLGTRYLLQPIDQALCFSAPGEPGQNSQWKREPGLDCQATVFSFLAGGMHSLPANTLYENRAALPRAFTVSRGVPLADREKVLEQLRTTNFRNVVLLEGAPALPCGQVARAEGDSEPAQIVCYKPNFIEIQADRSEPGYLILTDVWFPGWKCFLDGASVEIFRADYLFRAIALPAGQHRIVFSFDPLSYRAGRWVSSLALALLLVATALRACRKILSHSPSTSKPISPPGHYHCSTVGKYSAIKSS